jgi:hypothetical protein
LEEIILEGGFQILELRRGRDPLFSCPKSGHIRLQIFIKFEEFAKAECSSKDYTWLKKQILHHTRRPIELGVGQNYQI